MSQKDLEAFMAKVKNDKSLQEKLKGAKDANAVAAIATAAGWAVTGAEFVRHNAKMTSEMSDVELDAVAGGGPLSVMYSNRIGQGDCCGTPAKLRLI